MRDVITPTENDGEKGTHGDSVITPTENDDDDDDDDERKREREGSVVHVVPTSY